MTSSKDEQFEFKTINTNRRQNQILLLKKCLIVFGSFLIYFISDGVTFTFGIIIREMIKHFGKSVTETSFTASLLLSVPLFVSPLVCLLIEKYGCRFVATIGAFLLTLSFVLIKFFASNLIAIYVIFGIIGSIGLAMSYIPAYLIISFYFDKRRALATGIAVSGSGLGTFFLPPLMEFLIRKYDWIDACFIFGAIVSHMFISACLFFPIKLENSENPNHSDNKTQFKDILKTVKSLYSLKRFVILNISYSILSAFITTQYNFLPDHIRINSIDDPNSLSISIIGISTLVSQIVVGILSDKYRKLSWLIYSVFLMVGGIVTCLLPFCKTLYLIYANSLLFGFSVSVNYALQSILVIESAGLNNLTFAFGSLQLMQGFATIAGVPFVAFLKDLTGTYDITFYVSGFFIFLSGFILLLWPFLRIKRKLSTRL